MNYSPIIVALFAIAGVIVAWALVNTVKKKLVDRKFGGHISGGRGGDITLRMGNRTACAEYEPGAAIDFIVYRSSIKWQNGEQLSSLEIESFKKLVSHWIHTRGNTVAFE